MIKYLDNRILKHTKDIMQADEQLKDINLDDITYKILKNKRLAADMAKAECLIIRSQLTGSGF